MLSRRQFTASAGAGVALTVLGCDRRSDQPASSTGGEPSGGGGEDRRAHLATEPFGVGALDQYKAAGVYEQFKKDKGVWLVSDGKSLVALSAVCTHSGCTTRWSSKDKMFDCPCHSSRFDEQGMQQSGSRAKRPLERCTIKLVQEDGKSVVQVDPTKRFRQDEGQWSDPAASLSLA